MKLFTISVVSLLFEIQLACCAKRRPKQPQSSTFKWPSENQVLEALYLAGNSVYGYAKPQLADVKTILQASQHKFDNIEEFAMFLAQLVHESAGLGKLEEVECQRTNCPWYNEDTWPPFTTGKPGKSYYGRGYIMLSYPGNYLWASEGIGLQSKLWEHPEIVATDKSIAARVAVWFWEVNVRPVLKAGGSPYRFGVTTKAINPGVECDGQHEDKSKNRYKAYLVIAKALSISNRASEDGCYFVSP